MILVQSTLAVLGYNVELVDLMKVQIQVAIIAVVKQRLFITILKINNYLGGRLNNESNSILYACRCYTFR